MVGLKQQVEIWVCVKYIVETFCTVLSSLFRRKQEIIAQQQQEEQFLQQQERLQQQQHQHQTPEPQVHPHNILYMY